MLNCTQVSEAVRYQAQPPPSFAFLELKLLNISSKVRWMGRSRATETDCATGELLEVPEQGSRNVGTSMCPHALIEIKLLKRSRGKLEPFRRGHPAFHLGRFPTPLQSVL
jgi:hypothetical protein